MENDAQFKQRVVLQNFAFDILELLKMGVNVDSQKINRLRFQMGQCGFPFDFGSFSQQDAAEVIWWLIDQVSNPDGSDGIVYLQSTVKVDESKILVLGNNRSQINPQIKKEPPGSLLPLEISPKEIREL